MEEVKYSIAEIKKLMEQFVATKIPKSDSWYVEEDVMYRMYGNCFGSFIEYIEQDDEREQRRKLYEELKKEFEG